MKNTSGIDEAPYEADLWPAFIFADYFPRALPWASMGEPVGLEGNAFY
jgi:hypothetical protein